MLESTVDHDWQSLVAEWNPVARKTCDEMNPAAAKGLASTLDLDWPLPSGDLLPLLWHWTYFLDWPKTCALDSTRR